MQYNTAKSLQSYPTLCDPIDGSPPGSRIPGILQVRTLEWVAISFSNAWKWKVKGKSLSRVRLFTTPWTTAYQTLPSMGFSKQEYWSGVPLPSPIKCNNRVQIRKEEVKLSLFHFSLSCIGEGNGNPSQYSSLENPRDKGASWAAVYGGRTESDTTEAT